MTDTTRTLAEALAQADFSGHWETSLVGDEHAAAAFANAAAILATPAGRRLTTTDDPRIVAGLALERLAMTAEGAWSIDRVEGGIRVRTTDVDFVINRDAFGRTLPDAIAAALGGPDDD